MRFSECWHTFRERAPFPENGRYTSPQTTSTCPVCLYAHNARSPLTTSQPSLWSLSMRTAR
jgi:hypothetical protein